MSKKPCRSCPTKKCSNCPVKEKELKEEDIERAAVQSAANFGMPEKMWIEDTETGEMVFVNMKNPSTEAVKMLAKIYAQMTEK